MTLTRRSVVLSLAGTGLSSLSRGIVPIKRWSSTSVVLISSTHDPIAHSAEGTWALEHSLARLHNRGIQVCRCVGVEDATPKDICILYGGTQNDTIAAHLRRAGARVSTESESLCIASTRTNGRRLIVVAGADPAGLMYALLEILSRVETNDPVAVFSSFRRPLVEAPRSRTRSVMRAFSSELEDKSWFYDRDYWRDYLTMLASCRLNRINFTMGMAYNYASGITDGYLLFPYPFFVDVPGYSVRAAGLPDSERRENLAVLQFVGKEAAKRGIRLQIGVWTLAYRWLDSPNATYRVEGLDDTQFAPYCRDALSRLLEEVPEISGVTFRVHEESGIPIDQHGFWVTQFEAMARCPRKLEIDLHAKNMPAEALRAAIATGQRTVVSPKYCGEHMPLGYHPASIRRAEMQGTETLRDEGHGLLVGDRTFTRYGYADYLTAKRDWEVVYRIWPGTQRFLLSGDSELNRAFSLSADFCGASGIEWTEPLFFKGRMGSGQPGGRCGYVDPSLNPIRDFQKYELTYLLWGRLSYDPGAKADVWRREFERQYGLAATCVERALGAATRVLPLITLAHAEAADCQVYWPEIYSNVSLTKLDSADPEEIRDGGTFGHIGAFDPQLFQTPEECAEDLLSTRRTAKYTPIEVAYWLEDLASQIDAGLDEATRLCGDAPSAAYSRFAEDVSIQRGLALFFAAKLRAAVLWSLHLRTGASAAAQAAVARYESGRRAWQTMAERAQRVYRSDLSYGIGPRLGGHWIDRLDAIDRDLDRMRNQATVRGSALSASLAESVAAALAEPTRPVFAVAHHPPGRFRLGRDLVLDLSVDATTPLAVTLHYRHVDQAERWRSTPMTRRENAYMGCIPEAYTQTRFSLQYYFVIEGPDGRLAPWPTFGPQLARVPYFVAINERPS